MTGDCDRSSKYDVLCARRRSENTSRTKHPARNGSVRGPPARERRVVVCAGRRWEAQDRWRPRELWCVCALSFYASVWADVSSLLSCGLLGSLEDDGAGVRAAGDAQQQQCESAAGGTRQSAAASDQHKERALESIANISAVIGCGVCHVTHPLVDRSCRHVIAGEYASSSVAKQESAWSYC